MKPKELEISIDALKTLPGISRKNAENICNFILKQDKNFINDLFSVLVDLRYKVNFCQICNNITSNKINCDICEDSKRDQSELYIVSNFNDLNKIEEIGIYNGLYFNLNGEIDSKKKNVNDFDSIINKLENMINKYNIKNLLIATNMTLNGEFTSYYITSYLKKVYKNINIYRIATGLPINSQIDYIDLESLSIAIKNKIKI